MNRKYTWRRKKISGARNDIERIFWIELFVGQWRSLVKLRHNE
ncbi:hypothetical protein T4D_4057 [Trichinella pseudospiralis]|uniref:Uncharacterized protein n=1 Tax=Trichinella pseudospiralis TaxID=6337 RepID=A0A0V1DL26_TRIPS|nr:hypothetical protein T4D_4057 [Trichinella pseudospiralis]